MDFDIIGTRPRPETTLGNLPLFSGPRPVNADGKALDILTPRGQQTAADERKVARFCEAIASVQYIATPKATDSPVDALLVRGGELLAVVETKCRYNVTLAEFRDRFGNEWLLTEKKVQDGLAVAAMLRVPYWGFCYLVDDDTLLVHKNVGTAPHRVAVTETQATVNGGTAHRLNRYIDMTDAKVIVGMDAQVMARGAV